MKDAVLIHLEGGSQRSAGGPEDLTALVRADPGLIERLGTHLNGADPRVRGGAAGVLAEILGEFPDRMAAIVPDLVMALDHEEPPTRAGAFTALARIAESRADLLENDFDAIRLGLFEPLNAGVRRPAVQTVALFGSGDAVRARRAFPHLAEALRRFHDRPGASDLVHALRLMAETNTDRAIIEDIWRTLRRYEKHTDPEVRRDVAAVKSLIRETAVGDSHT
jgi:hypothetical protein